MTYRILADATLLLHLLFIVYVIFGGLLVPRYPRLAFFHLPAACWGVFVELTGRGCPLTSLEVTWRRAAGDAGYTESFIEHYLLAMIYPAGLTSRMQLGLAVGVVLVNLVIYGWVLLRQRRL